MVSVNEELRDKMIKQSLTKIVDRFNIEMDEWKKKTNCEADLQWGYTNGRVLEIRSINYCVYRKGLPPRKTMEEMAKDMKENFD